MVNCFFLYDQTTLFDYRCFYVVKDKIIGNQNSNHIVYHLSKTECLIAIFALYIYLII